MTIPTIKKLLYAANLLAGLGLAAFVATSSTAAFESVYKPVSAGTASPTRPPTARPRPAKDYSSCWDEGGPDNPPPTGVAQQDTRPMQAVKRRYKLYSTFFVRSPDKREGYAAIAYDRQERVYAENERVGEYVLAQVFPNSVILKKGGVSFTLERASGAGRASSPSRSRSPGKAPRKETSERRRQERSLRTARPSTVAGGKANTQQFTVSEKDKDYITENFAKILHDVNFQTELAKEDESMTGIKINKIKPGSILYKVGGLRPGDIIRKVNGKPINSLSQAISIYGSLTKSNVKRVDVEIERKGKIFNRTYSITDPGR